MTDVRTEELAKKKCTPCEGGIPPMTKEQAQVHLQGLPNWALDEDGKCIRAKYRMKDFKAAVKLVRDAGDIAEEQGHHPDFHLTQYRKLTICLSTHAIDGLSENDFIMAAKIEALPKEFKVRKT